MLIILANHFMDMVNDTLTGQKPLRSLSPPAKTGRAVKSPSAILQGRSLSPSSIFKGGQKPLRDFARAVKSPSAILQGRSLSPSSIFKGGQKPLR